MGFSLPCFIKAWKLSCLKTCLTAVHILVMKINRRVMWNVRRVCGSSRLCPYPSHHGPARPDHIQVNIPQTRWTCESYQATIRDPSFGGLVSHIKHQLKSGILEAFRNLRATLQSTSSPSGLGSCLDQTRSRRTPGRSHLLFRVRPSPYCRAYIKPG
ncbi:hypothetical protein IGI04_026159 [Brassica rapa subsp. trilocularis]|uniref:Uncharacterized protein n=1 Tax=Brassica rapa subsp. trilocularis TaxID=1813537 RepID=A0ABQ7KVH2_BRACM|nr:hypothetical protein IGI04_026159 [Brassica rapa subsp. trilocularis]